MERVLRKDKKIAFTQYLSLNRLLKLKLSPKGYGFTLVELLVVISIIGIMAVMAIPAFNNYEKINALRLTAEEIQSCLQEAQSLSIGPRASGFKFYNCELYSSTGDVLVKADGATRNDRISKAEIKTKISFPVLSGSAPTILKVKYTIPGGAITDPPNALSEGFIYFVVRLTSSGDQRKRCLRLNAASRNVELSKMYSGDETANTCKSQF